MICFTVASKPVIRANSATNSSGEVTVESYTTEASPDGYATTASSTPSTRLRATRAVAGQLSQVIPVTTSSAVTMFGIAADISVAAISPSS